MSPRTPSEGRLQDLLGKLEQARPVQMVGRVRSVTGLVLQATASQARLGDVVLIARAGEPLLAEVVGLRDELVTLLPLGDPRGIGPDSDVMATGAPLSVGVGADLLGRVLNALGRPIDGAPEPGGLQPWPVLADAPRPLDRRRIDTPFGVGIRAVDGLLTLGRGQRVGLFAGAGVGKSSLLGQIARQAEAEVIVIALVGERGREVREFLEDALGPTGLARSVVVVATANEPALLRVRSAHVATAIAEYFREQGRNVLFLMDSLTRFARAQRDAGLAAGELPARHGYPPSVFAALPQLLERSGNSQRGTMTALYTVLVAGDDLHEPIADEVRGLLDGHLVLSRQLAERGQWPAIDVLRSPSRTMSQLTAVEHRRAAAEFRRLLSVYESKRDLIALGAYRHGSDAQVDEAIDRIEDLERYLRQGLDDGPPLETSIAGLLALCGE